MNGNGTLLYALVICLLIMACELVSYEYHSMRNQAVGVEDALATSLIGASRVNLAEYGATNEIAIHERLPKEYRKSVVKYIVGGTIKSDIKINLSDMSLFPNSPENDNVFRVTAASKDNYLEWSKNKFKELLKSNLNLDDNMVPKEKHAGARVLRSTYTDENTQQEQPNKVNIDEYTVINIYRFVDEYNNPHTYTVVYRSENDGDFMIVPILSGRDKQTIIGPSRVGWDNTVTEGKCDDVAIVSTSVYARISFYTDIGKDLSGNKHSRKQIVDRVTTIKEF